MSFSKLTWSSLSVRTPEQEAHVVLLLGQPLSRWVASDFLCTIKPQPMLQGIRAYSHWLWWSCWMVIEHIKGIIQIKHENVFNLMSHLYAFFLRKTRLLSSKNLQQLFYIQGLFIWVSKKCLSRKKSTISVQF